MSTVLIIFSLTLTQIGMYLFLKSSIENVLEYYSNNNLKEKQSEAIKLQSAESIKQNDTTVLPKKVDNTNHLVLNKSLRHLEFISQFEMYLEDKNYKSFFHWSQLRFWPVGCRCILAIYLHSCLWRYPGHFKRADDCDYGLGHGAVYRHSNLAVSPLLPGNAANFCAAVGVL